jgi:hypothetical protein
MITSYLQRPASKHDQTVFEELTLRMTISNGWAFCWTENEETKSWWNFISNHPNIFELPSRRALGGRILQSTSNVLKNSIEDHAKNDKFGIMVAFDGWTNIIKQEILGIVLVTSMGETLVWGGEDISSERAKYTLVIEKVKMLFQKLEEIGIKVNGLVTDSAPEYSAARYNLKTFRYITLFDFHLDFFF